MKTPQVGHHVQFVWKPSNFSTHYLENLSTLLVNKFYRISLWTFAVNTSCFGHWFHFFWIPLNFRELLSFIKEQVLVYEEKLSTFNVNTLRFATKILNPVFHLEIGYRKPRISIPYLQHDLKCDRIAQKWHSNQFWKGLAIPFQVTNPIKWYSQSLTVSFIKWFLRSKTQKTSIFDICWHNFQIGRSRTA